MKSLEQISINIVESLKLLQKGIHHKQTIETVTGMMSAVLNGLSFGIAVQEAFQAGIDAVADT
eukprot:12898339-Ditylum_brightwellii.AAC.1